MPPHPFDESVPGTPEREFRPVFGPKAERLERVAPPRKTKGMAGSETAMRRHERMGQAVRLRVAGLGYDEIAAELGCSMKTASDDVDRWVEAQKPSEEMTEQLRHIMLERLESLHATYWKVAHGVFEDRWGRQVPNEKAAEILLKIQDRQAKLMGVDLQPNTVNITVTAESIAQFLGWDDVIDVPASPREIGPVTE